MQEGCHTDELICRVHFICMSDTHDKPDPTVTILLVSTVGEKAVYASTGAWSHYRNWIKKVLRGKNPKYDLNLEKEEIFSKQLFFRRQFPPFLEVTMPACELAVNGFDRVDRY